MSKLENIGQALKPVSRFVAERYSAAGAHFEQADLMATYSEEMTNPRRPLLVGGLLILVTFFGLGLWAATAPLGSAAMAPGVIVVESNRRTIQHLEGGIVHDILVDDGSEVKAGDVLVRMDDTRAHAQLAILQSDLYSNLAIQARLSAERDGLAAPDFPAELKTKAADPAVAAIMQSQVNQFNARKAAILGQKSILEQRIQQYDEQIVGLKALQTSKEIQLSTIREELKGLAGLLEQGYVTKPRVLALQREEARLVGEAGDHVSAIARSQQGIGEAKLQIFQLEKSRQEEIARDVRDTQARIAEGQQKVVAADDVMHRIEVVAPVAGMVMNLQIHTKGGVVNPGQPLLEIVPAGDKLVVDVQISPMDIDTVHPGQAVSIHVSAADTRTTPVIEGVLETVSADRIVDQRTGMPYYKGRVTIPPEQLARLTGLKLHSGMMAEAMIKRGEQTALSYLLKPMVESFARSFKEK